MSRANLYFPSLLVSPVVTYSWKLLPRRAIHKDLSPLPSLSLHRPEERPEDDLAISTLQLKSGPLPPLP